MMNDIIGNQLTGESATAIHLQVTTCHQGGIVTCKVGDGGRLPRGRIVAKSHVSGREAAVVPDESLPLLDIGRRSECDFVT